MEPITAEAARRMASSLLREFRAIRDVHPAATVRSQTWDAAGDFAVRVETPDGEVLITVAPDGSVTVR